MVEHTKKPAQFRFPAWAHEFLAEESKATGMSKTEVLVEALATYKTRRFDEHLGQCYAEVADQLLEEVREWDSTLPDGLEDDEW